jgi:hypothetical protein
MFASALLPVDPQSSRWESHTVFEVKKKFDTHTAHADLLKEASIAFKGVTCGMFASRNPKSVFANSIPPLCT